MGRPKKDGKSLNCYIEREIFEELEKYCEKKGQTKTIVIERALQKLFKENSQKLQKQ